MLAFWGIAGKGDNIVSHTFPCCFEPLCPPQCRPVTLLLLVACRHRAEVSGPLGLRDFGWDGRPARAPGACHGLDQSTTPWGTGRRSDSQSISFHSHSRTSLCLLKPRGSLRTLCFSVSDNQEHAKSQNVQVYSLYADTGKTNWQTLSVGGYGTDGGGRR